MLYRLIEESKDRFDLQAVVVLLGEENIDWVYLYEDDREQYEFMLDMRRN